MTLKNCTISGNSASFGGGLMIISQFKSNATIDNCIITGNKATDKGGGIYWSHTQPEISSTSKVLGNSPDEIYPAI